MLVVIAIACLFAFAGVLGHPDDYLQCPVGKTIQNSCVDMCMNGGTYLDIGNGVFVCMCIPGFNGTKCEDAENCHSELCLNGASCVSTHEGIKCICAPGYTGNRCEDWDHCLNTTCLNGGTCVSCEDTYKCVCPQGFTGTQCQDFDYCRNNSCKSWATCINLSNRYYCACPSNFDGTYCEDIPAIFRCLADTCLNGGSCNEYDHVCDCPIGYNGTRCEVIP